MIDIGKPTEEPEQKPADIGDASRFGEFTFDWKLWTSKLLSVRYNLRKDILKLKTIGATVEFKVSELEKLLTKVQVGSRPIKNFSMVERHFFRNKLLKSFIFEFGFVIPDSINNAEHIYEVSVKSTALKYESNFRCQNLTKNYWIKSSKIHTRRGQIRFTLSMVSWLCTIGTLGFEYFSPIYLFYKSEVLTQNPLLEPTTRTACHNSISVADFANKCTETRLHNHLVDSSSTKNKTLHTVAVKMATSIMQIKIVNLSGHKDTVWLK